MIEIDKEGSEFSQLETWIPVSKRINDFMTPTSTMQLFVSISDLAPNNNATEGGFDNFRVTEGPYLSVNDFEEEFSGLTAYPNPFSHLITIEGLEVGAVFILMDMKGAILFEGIATENQTHINTESLPNGIYILRSGNEVFKMVK